ncbi:MAG: hypothetical protein ACOCNB_02490 [Acetivibrio ethanolgignens]
MAKNNSKSIRLSDKVLFYIEKFEGKGFNEKFENIILYAMESENVRRKRIETLDKLIKEKEKNLQELSSRYYDLSSRLLTCDRAISSILRELQNVSQ